jgi:hypothetical protein
MRPHSRRARAHFTLTAPQTARVAAAAATLPDEALVVGSKLSIRHTLSFSDMLVAAIIEAALRECRR